MYDHDTHGHDEPGCGLAAAEHDLLRRRLAAMPDVPPPHDLWRRIRIQARAEGLLRSGPPRQPLRWLAGAGLAAAVLLAVLRGPGAGTDPAGGKPFPTEPPYTATAAATTLDALRVRSERLERNLRALPREPGVMRAGTAATIGELEERIAAIDYVLNDPAASLTADEAERYWRERVRLMDSLVEVRYAQARRNSL